MESYEIEFWKEFGSLPHGRDHELSDFFDKHKRFPSDDEFATMPDLDSFLPLMEKRNHWAATGEFDEGELYSYLEDNNDFVDPEDLEYIDDPEDEEYYVHSKIADEMVRLQYEAEAARIERNNGKITKYDEWACIDGRHILSHTFGDKKTYFELDHTEDECLLYFYANENEKREVQNLKKENFKETDLLACYDFHYSNTNDLNAIKKMTENAISAYENHFFLVGNVNVDEIQSSIGGFLIDLAKPGLEDRFNRQPKDVWVKEDEENWLGDKGWSVEELKHDFSGMQARFIISTFNPRDEYTSIECCMGHNGVKARHVFEKAMSVEDAEKIVEKTIDHYDQKPNVGIVELKNSLLSQVNEYNNPQNLTLISDVLSNGKSQTVRHYGLGEIYVGSGLAGENGYGLLHIIGDKYCKNLDEDEISALLYKVVDTVQNGEPFIQNGEPVGSPERPIIVDGMEAGCIGIEKDGVIGFVSKVQDDNEEKFVMTGFAFDEKKKGATESMRTVIAAYGTTPAFSDIRKQVGAAVSSLNQASPHLDEESIDFSKNDKSLERQLKTANKAGYVQGVCECVAAVCEDHALGKKLLTEMNVTKGMARQFAKPETYKALEQGIFAPKQEQKMEQVQGVRL